MHAWYQLHSQGCSSKAIKLMYGVAQNRLNSVLYPGMMNENNYCS